MLLALPILATVAAFFVGRAWGFSAGHEAGATDERDPAFQAGFMAGMALAREEQRRPKRLELVTPVGMN